MDLCFRTITLAVKWRTVLRDTCWGGSYKQGGRQCGSDQGHCSTSGERWLCSGWLVKVEPRGVS